MSVLNSRSTFAGTGFTKSERGGGGGGSASAFQKISDSWEKIGSDINLYNCTVSFSLK